MDKLTIIDKNWVEGSVRVIFSEMIAHSRQWDVIYQAAEALSKLSLDDLNFGYGQQRQGIKRLFFSQSRRIPLWRYRHDDQRVIFWAGLKENQETATLWLAGHRSTVYETLSRKLPQIRQHLQVLLASSLTDFEVWEDRLAPPEQECPWQDLVESNPCFRWPRHASSVQEIVTYIQEGLFRFQPVLSEKQAAFAKQAKTTLWRPFAPLILPIQGGAGTGKTTLGVEILQMFMGVPQDIYPLLILPNPTLANRARAAVLAHFPHSSLASDWRDHAETPTKALITTRDDLIQALAGDRDPALSLAECNRRLRHQLRHQGDWSGIPNLYGLLRGYSPDPQIAYPSNHRDPLSQRYEEWNQRLQQAWRPDYEALFEGRDPYAQGQRALAALDQIGVNPHASRRYILILDEIQDYYWFQLQVLVRFSQRINPQPLLILLGDENQRVTVSGFTWSALATALHQQTGIVLPQRLELTENFRNTVEIARLARHTLLEGFRHLITWTGRHLRDPGLPGHQRSGKKPRLQVISEDRALVEQLGELLAPSPAAEQAPNYIFLLSPDSPWKNYLRQVDPEERFLIPYTIAEAKGQEFEAVIWVHPFAGCGNTLTPEQIFQWYTTITRARSYLVWILSPEEHQWLTEQAGHWSEPLSHFFQDQSLELSDFLQELRQEARTQLTLDQRRERVIHTFSQELYLWLQGGSPPSLPKNLEAVGWDPWQFLAALSQTEPDLEGLEKAGFTTAAWPIGDPLTDVICYWVSYCWAEATGTTLPNSWRDQARQALGTYLSQHPEHQQAALDAGDPEWQSFVYWALGRSWQAGIHINQHCRESHFQKNQAMIRAISQHLEHQGLSLEAQRLRVHLGLEDPPADLASIPHLWDPSTPHPTTATRLCQHLVVTLSELLPPLSPAS